MKSLMIFWAIVTVVLFIIECLSSQLISIWFAVGGLVSLILASFNASIEMQILTFLAISIIMLLLVRPFCNKYLEQHITKTNAQQVIGSKVIALSDFKDGEGRVQADGMDWRARVEGDMPIFKGDELKVKDLVGVTLIVKKEKE